MAEVVRNERSSGEQVWRITKAVLRVLFIIMPFVFVYLVATDRIVLGEPYRTIVLLSMVFIVGGVVVAFFLIIVKIAMLLFFGSDEF